MRPTLALSLLLVACSDLAIGRKLPVASIPDDTDVSSTDTDAALHTDTAPPPADDLLTPTIEPCDGVDNDGDGTVDEGWGDADEDGIADCVDVETCNGDDDNGNGQVDEGYPDADGDGIKDCVDEEVCDGVDNNGDAVADEGFPDTDRDGIADCVDVELCNGVDDNGLDGVDEGFPDTDGDGIADCVDREVCNGDDDDGNGVVDDGWPDVTGDGVPDCDVEICNGLDDDDDGDVDEGFPRDAEGRNPCCNPGPYVATWDDAGAGLDVRWSLGDGTFSLPSRVLTAPDQGLWAIGTFDDRQPPQLLYRDGTSARLMWCDIGNRWTSAPTATPPAGALTYGDLDQDGCLDIAGADYPAASYGRSGDGIGWVAEGDCLGGFTIHQPEPWNVLFLAGYWSGSPTHRADDWDGDGDPDIAFWAVANGGTTTASAWFLPGDAGLDFGEELTLPDVPAAGSGELRDVDGDGCVDWLLGANDDGHAGEVTLVRGDCAGGVKGSGVVARTCGLTPGVCYGDGVVRTGDWDGNGTMDLLVTVTTGNGGRAELFSVSNLGGGTFDAPRHVTTDWGLYRMSLFTSVDPDP